MIARHTVIRVQTLSKSEYNNSKHIPNANPSTPISQETGEPAILVEPTPLPLSYSPSGRSSERRLERSLPGTEERSAQQKRTQRTARGFELGSPPGNESYLAKEMQVLGEELDEARQEIHHLRQEREYMIKDFEERLEYMRAEGATYEDDRKIQELETENAALREELNARASIRSDYRGSTRNDEELRNQLNQALGDREYFENQFQSAKMIQISLEQELRQKTDERNKLFSDYEVKIASLQNEIAALRSHKNEDTLRQSQVVDRVKDENSVLSAELTKLRQQKNDLETQVESLMRERLDAENSGMKLRLSQFEAQSVSYANQLDQERRNSQTLRNALQQKDIEIHELREKLERTEQYDHLHVMLMAEVERLHILLAARITEIDALQVKYTQEIQTIQIKNESSLRDSLRTELLQVHNQLQEERSQTEVEITRLRKVIADYESKVIILKDDLNKANKRAVNQSFETDSIISQSGSKLEAHMLYDSAHKSDAIKRSGKKIDEVEESVNFTVERTQLENVIRNLKVKIAEFENKEVLYMIEIERLGNVVAELEEEADGWQLKAQEAEYKAMTQSINIQTESPVKSGRGDDLVRELESRISYLQSENEALQKGNLQRTKEADEWRIKCTQIEMRLGQASENFTNEFRIKQQTEMGEIHQRYTQERIVLENQLGQARSKLTELESKVLLLSSEKTQFTQSIAHKDHDIEALRRKLMDNEENYHRMIDQLKAQFEASFKQRIEIELLSRNSQVSSEKSVLETNLQNAKSRIAYLEEQLAILNTEIQRARQESFEKSIKIEELSARASLVGDRDMEIQAWKNRYEDIQRTHAQDIDNLTTRMNLAMKEDLGREMRQSQVRWETDKILMEDKLRVAIHQKEQLEEKIILLGGEISRMEKVISTLREENAQWKGKAQEFEQTLMVVKIDFENRMRSTVEKDTAELNARFSHERNELENQIIRLRAELDRLNNILNEKEYEIETLRQGKSELERHHETNISTLKQQHESILRSRLELELKEQGSRFQPELEQERARNSELEEELALVKNQNYELQDILEGQKAQLEEQDQRLQQLQEEHDNYVEELKNEIQTQLTEQFEGNMKELTERFLDERKQLENQIRKLKSRVNDLERGLGESEERNSRLLDEIEDHNRRNEDYKEKYTELEKNSVNSLKDLEDKLEKKRTREVEEAVKRSSNRHQDEYQELEANYNRALEKIELLESKAALLAVEVDRISKLHTQTLIELDEARENLNRSSSHYTSEKTTNEYRYNLLNDRIQDYERRIAALNEELLNQNRANAERVRELEELRARSQGTSSQWNIDKSILESQINMLNDKIKEYERRIGLLNEEINNLHMSTVNRNSELEELRAMARNSSSQWSLERSSLESQLIILQEKVQSYEQKLGHSHSEVERLTALHANQVNELNESRRRLEQYERDSQGSLENLRIQIEVRARQEREEQEARLRQIFEQRRTEYEGQVQKMQEAIAEYERKIMTLQSELETVGFQNRAKADEIRQWREKTTLIETIKNQEIERLREEFAHERQVLETQWVNEKFAGERSQFNTKIRELKVQVQDLENRITYLTVELEKQVGMYKSKSKEVEGWREKYNKLESSKFVEIDEVKNQVELLRRSSLQISDYEVRFKAERAAYEAQTLQYKQKLEELETKISYMTIEQERINDLYLEKKKEVETIRLKSSNTVVDLSITKELESLRREVESLKREKFDHNASKVKFDVERRNFQNELDQLHQTIAGNKLEIAKLYDLIDTRRSESENLVQELTEAREEIAKNIKYYKELETEYLALNSRYDQVMKEAGDLQRSKELYRSQVEVNSREMAKRNRELIHRIHEVDSLKTRYEEAYASMEPVGTLGTASSKVLTRLSAVGIGGDHHKSG